MSKSIYQEAIEKAQWFKHGLLVSDLDIQKVDFIQGVLKQAQKEEKLKGLYKEKSKILSALKTVSQLTMNENLRLIEIDDLIKELENEKHKHK